MGVGFVTRAGGGWGRGGGRMASDREQLGLAGEPVVFKGGSGGGGRWRVRSDREQLGLAGRPIVFKVVRACVGQTVRDQGGRGGVPLGGGL